MSRLPLYAALAALVLAPLLSAQNARPQVRIDVDPTANTPDGFDVFTRGDGDLRAAMWVDERDLVNTFDDDIFVAVSTDNGLTWAPEVNVTNLAVSAFDVDNQWLAVGNGVIHVAWDDDRNGSADPAAVYSRSTDNGATWTETILQALDGQDPKVEADGDNVCVVWYDQTTTPNLLISVWSTDGGATFAASQTVDAAGGDVDSDGYWLQVSGTTAHLIFFDDRNGNNDCFYSQSANGAAWSAPIRLDSDPSGTGDVDTNMRMVIDGSNVHCAWYEDGRDPLNSADDELFYCRSTDGGATFSAEVQLSTAAPTDVDWLSMDADGSNVLVTWVDDEGNTTTNELARVRVSNDGGATFGVETEIPGSGAGGPEDAQWTASFVDGNLMIVCFEDDSWNTASVDELPSFAYSADGGATWNGPFLCGSGFEADEDVDTETTAFFYDNGSLTMCWQTDGGAANPDVYYAGGIRFPFIDIVDNTGSLDLSMGGVDSLLAGDTARWAGSLTTGSVVHPDNPLLTLDLGASAVYTKTLAKANLLSATVQPDGTASKTVNLPAPASGKTVFVQAWVTSAGVGGYPSDVLEITLL